MLDKQLVKIKMEDIQGYLKELEPLLKEEAREIMEYLKYINEYLEKN